MRIKSFMANYYDDGWDEGVAMLDDGINTWIGAHPNYKIEDIKHVRFNTKEAIHIWYTILED